MRAGAFRSISVADGDAGVTGAGATLLDKFLEDVDVIAPARFSAADGLQLSADIAGEPWRPRLIFLHGGGQSRRSWRLALRVFASSGYSVVSYDLRGHGESDWSQVGDYSLDAHVRDLLCIIRSSPGRPALIGASLGGRVALAAAAQLGLEAISSLVLVDLTPKLNPAGLARVQAFLDASRHGFSSFQAAVATLNRYAESPQDRLPDGLRHSLSRAADGRFYWRWDPAAGLDANLDPIIVEDTLRQASRRLEVPTLLIRGSESDLVTPDCVADFLEAKPDAEVIDIEGQGHLMRTTNRDIFCQASLAFIGRHQCA